MCLHVCECARARVCVVGLAVYSYLWFGLLVVVIVLCLWCRRGCSLHLNSVHRAGSDFRSEVRALQIFHYYYLDCCGRNRAISLDCDVIMKELTYFVGLLGQSSICGESHPALLDCDVIMEEITCLVGLLQKESTFHCAVGVTVKQTTIFQWTVI